jgi:lipoic acid synthetase
MSKTPSTSNYTALSRSSQDTHKRGEAKIAHIPIKVEVSTGEYQRKPSWIRAKVQSSPEVIRIKKLLRENKLHSVCEEAQCPNLGECFSHGTATFMVMGDICTRRCSFCDVAHGNPNPLDKDEPKNLAKAIGKLNLKYVVITSVDRDDLRDGGAEHFADCIRFTREENVQTQIEVLVPDFRKRMEIALPYFDEAVPDVFNHNMETVPRLYKTARPRSSYQGSVDLLSAFKQRHPNVRTKSGLMVGLGEKIPEIEQVMQDLRDHDVDMLTIGQYLQPSKHHIAVSRFVHPNEFKHLEELGYKMGFSHVASGPMVRSSYHADLQAKEVLQK